MGWASVGALGNAHLKAAGTREMGFTATRAVSVGQLVAIWVSWESRGPSGGIGLGRVVSPSHLVVDARGNIYTAIFSREDSGTTAATGAIFVSQIQHALSVGDLIRDLYINTLPVARSIAGHVFSMDAGMYWLANDVGPKQEHTTSGDPVTVTLSGLDSQEYLFLHLLGSRGPDTDAYTWDANWTQITGDGTTGGADTSNVQLRGGYRILTGTGASCTVTSDTADRDYVQGMVALSQYPLPAFPTTPVLDTCTRANEDPIDGGLWDASACTASFNFHLKLVSNEIVNQSTVDGGSWWLTSNASNDAEVYVTLTTAGPAGLALHASGCGEVSTRSGYGAEWNPSGGLFIADCIYTGDLGNSAGISGGAGWLSQRDPANGDKLGLQKDGSALICWLNEGVSWVPIAGMYCQQEVHTDGKMGLTMKGNVPHCDDFGGGIHVPVIPTLHLLPLLHVGA